MGGSVMHQLLKQLEQVQLLATGSKWRRLLAHPFRYVWSIGFKKLIYPFTKKGIIIKTAAFFGGDMYVVLPAGADIYLTGSKSHDSEIRLAKWLIRQLKPGDVFIDVGAHFGYFSLLAAALIKSEGRVFSFEASKSTFSLLKKNTQYADNITCLNNAVSDKNELLVFHEFPVLYSEYNSLNIDQFKNEKWFFKYRPRKIEIEAIILDDFIEKNNIQPSVIKIDVEGAEYQVISGLKKLMATPEKTPIVMEYLHPDRKNESHRQAVDLMRKNGYHTYLINADGELYPVDDLDDYLLKNGMESDNVLMC